MTSDQTAQVFSPFMQADPSVTRKYGGAGLGLALSRRLAKGMDGGVRIIRSTLGQGSVFEATVRADPQTSETFISFDRMPGRLATLAEPDGKFKNKRFLVAEDFEDNQILISKILESAGGVVDVVDNGVDAVAKAFQGRYDVILMDIQMPKLDGLSATKALRNEGYKGKIVALSAYALPEEVTRALEAGCNSHVAKPIDLNRLITAIN